MIRQVFISVFPRLCKETKVKAFKDRAHSPISEQARFRLLLRVISFEIYSSQPYVATGGQNVILCKKQETKVLWI